MRQHVLKLAEESEFRPGIGDRHALVRQQELGHRPALSLCSDEIGYGNAHVIEENLVGVVLSVDRHDRLDRDPRRFHVDEQRSEEHTSELQSLMRSSYAVFCLKKKKK